MKLPLTPPLAAFALVLSCLELPVASLRATPVVTSPSTASGQVGQPFNYEITTAAQNDKNNVNATGLPPGLGVVVSVTTVNGRTTSFAGVQGTPTAAGTFPATLSLKDNTGTADFSLTITVAPPAPTAPVITSAPAADAKVGQPFAYQITTTLNNATGFGASGLPDGLAIDANTGTISGAPAAAGTFPVTLRASNAVGVGTLALNLTVAPVLPTVTLLTTAPQAFEGGGKGVFTFSRDSADLSADLTVSYKIRGGAVGGVQYKTLPGTVVIPAGSAVARIKVKAINNDSHDGNSTLKLTLLSGEGYVVGTPDTAKVKIIDND